MGCDYMKKDADLEALVKTDAWHALTRMYAPEEVVRELSFRDALRVVYRLMYNKKGR